MVYTAFLPPSLQLDNTGKISGTVQSEVGIPETNYTVFVRDSLGTQRASTSFSLVVNPPLSFLKNYIAESCLPIVR
ncbi:hypothetical protein QJQ08_00105 [Chlamydia suis]|uniref:hypothetical protein n=1 Tax=Chlamydia suis TaxID=83559 RepID=UPI002B3DEAFD|nr:hypothetical protein [Chlamydia suis]MEB2694225.1 hypothetical protein [Chlamydia suis]